MLSGSWNFTDIGGNIHEDNHAFVFDPTNSSIIYTGNDGGIYKSTDRGTTWIDSINKVRSGLDVYLQQVTSN